MNNERSQILIITFLGLALTLAVLSICYGTIASKPIDVAAVQFAGTISGAFAALLVGGKNQTHSGGNITIDPPANVTVRDPKPDEVKP